MRLYSLASQTVFFFMNVILPSDMIKLSYSRDHKGVGVAHEKTTRKPASLFSDDEAVLVKRKQAFRSVKH